MILPIYTYGQPVLKKETQEITPDYPDLAQTIQNMWDTLTHSGGVGLAAPQVGLPIRMAIIDLDIISDDEPQYKGYKRLFINPYIEEYSPETDTQEEGCLSLPGLSDKITRSTRIRVTKTSTRTTNGSTATSPVSCNTNSTTSTASSTPTTSKVSVANSCKTNSKPSLKANSQPTTKSSLQGNNPPAQKETNPSSPQRT